MRMAAIGADYVGFAATDRGMIADADGPVGPDRVRLVLDGLTVPVAGPTDRPVTATLVVVDPVEWVGVARRAGWEVGPVGETGWRTAWMPAGLPPDGRARVLHVWDAPTRTAQDDLMAAAAGVYQDGGKIAPLGALRRAAWWFRTVGHAYHGTPGLATLDVVRRMAARADRDGGPARYPVAQVTRPAGVPSSGELVWRAPTRTRREHGQVYQWDMRAAYLAAAGAAELGWGEPVPTGTDPEHGAPGWYRVRPEKAALTVAGVPVVDKARIGRDGTVWVTEPLVRWWSEYGTPVEIIDSITSRTHGRLMRSWAERWRDILARSPWEPGRNVLKLGYVQAIGLLGRPAGRLARPDWHDTIRATARVSMLRRVARVYAATGLTPCRVNTDAAFYRLTDAGQVDAVSACIGLGDRIGNMRYEGEYVDAA